VSPTLPRPPPPGLRHDQAHSSGLGAHSFVVRFEPVHGITYRSSQSFANALTWVPSSAKLNDPPSEYFRNHSSCHLRLVRTNTAAHHHLTRRRCRRTPCSVMRLSVGLVPAVASSPVPFLSSTTSKVGQGAEFNAYCLGNRVVCTKLPRTLQDSWSWTYYGS
jgi:hypothetical protein